MNTHRCVRCGLQARGFATLNGYRLCHTDSFPTCYQAARAAFNGHNWDQLQAHWLDVQVATQLRIEQMRRTDLSPLSPQFTLATIESVLESL